MTDDVPELEPWTEAGGARLRAAADDLIAAIAAHADAVTSAGGDFDLVFAASDRLVPAALAYAQAQVEYSGYAFPFGVLHDYLEDDEEDDDEEDSQDADEAGDAVPGVSVIQRRDYAVSDADAVMAAGREAYLRVWPEDSPEAAAADVTHLGRALYQLAHAGGWDNLAGVDGLEPAGSITAVVRQDELLVGDPDEWADDLVDEDAELLYLQSDVYRRT